MHRLQRYFQQSWAELAKVVWPTRRQAIRLTIAVIIFSLVLAAFIGIVDYFYTLGLQSLISKG
ncbi:MAG TPA: preprotein translocase subunit SecE [Candidatus Saccharimonadales bacterium]|nr:preprotein translocase subunit SecE [Candidatus Saccharimonadales bacterium]